MKKIINCETGEILERELTEDEIAQQAIDETKIEQLKAEAEANAQAQAAAKAALLERLGITEEEAKLLLS